MARARAGELLRSEDWVSVWLGAVLIILVLVGVRPEAAGLSCGDGIGGLFAPGRLATTLGVGAALLVLCTAGVRVMEGSTHRFAVGFAALFGLAWAARAVACDSALSDRGVNYAITFKPTEAFLRTPFSYIVTLLLSGGCPCNYRQEP